MGDRLWDLAVVGAGPAGARAALAAARKGLSVVLIERAPSLPRYKTCGGGLTGRSLSSLALAGLDLPGTTVKRDAVTSVTFSHEGRRKRSFTEEIPFLSMVDRPTFDAWLVRQACEAGAELLLGVKARRLDESDGVVSLTTANASVIHARCVVGADGASGVCSSYVGARYSADDLGLELELGLNPAQQDRWRHAIALDWGPMAGSYGWLFPKGDTATLGVITHKLSRTGNRQADELRKYLDALRASLVLEKAPILMRSGHLVRIRNIRSPLCRGRLLLAGDAAGLAEPWTREGISFAMQSGEQAGLAAAGVVQAAGSEGLASVTNDYVAFIDSQLQQEFEAGKRFYTFFAKHPVLTHIILTRLPRARRAFLSICRGDSTLASTLDRRGVSAGLSIFSALGRG